MIINISGTKLNITFKGKELGFGLNEKKMLSHILTEAEEKQFAAKYSHLVIFQPDPSTVKKMINDKIASVSTINIQPKKQQLPEQESDYMSKKESVNFMSAQTFTTKEKDVADVEDKKETFSLDKQGYKDFQKSNEIAEETMTEEVEVEEKTTETKEEVETEEKVVEKTPSKKSKKNNDWKKHMTTTK